MITSNPTMDWLQDWYSSHCDGDWEHEFGIHIGTIDNPGWRISIDLGRTSLEQASFKAIQLDNSESDWYRCWVAASKFEGCGDPGKLTMLIDIFRAWVQEQIAKRRNE